MYCLNTITIITWHPAAGLGRLTGRILKKIETLDPLITRREIIISKICLKHFASIHRHALWPNMKPGERPSLEILMYNGPKLEIQNESISRADLVRVSLGICSICGSGENFKRISSFRPLYIIISGLVRSPGFIFGHNPCLWMLPNCFKQISEKMISHRHSFDFSPSTDSELASSTASLVSSRASLATRQLGWADSPEKIYRNSGVDNSGRNYYFENLFKTLRKHP